MLAYVLTAIILVIYFVFVWFLAPMLHLHGGAVWAFRALLALIGVAAAAAFLWFRHKNSEADSMSIDNVVGDECDQRITEALQRFRQITRDHRRHLSDCPIAFVIGAAGTTKTSLLVNSGIDADLLSGLLDRDGTVVPTSSINLLLAHNTVFVELGSPLLEYPGAIKRVLRRLNPNNFSSALRSSQTAHRSIIVCADCELFHQPTDVVAAVNRKLGAMLHEAAEVLGNDIPVYVVFTKLDRVSGFNEYVRNFSKEEAAQLLGATIPMRVVSGGVYAEEETRRLASYFDQLMCSLAEKRAEVLSRETDAAKIGSAYEFPREIRKLRTGMVEFLVDLCRPSQMPSNPKLRGFYFCGVRPLLVQEFAVAQHEPVAAVDSAKAGATRMFRFDGGSVATAPAPQPVASSRKIPQWAFAAHLFSDVILRDREASPAPGASTHVNVIRRALLLAASFFVVVWIVATCVSYASNRAMIRTVSTAAEALPISPSQELPSLENLQKLDSIRVVLTQLAAQRQGHPPMHMRWGLYSGEELYPEAKRIYFSRFNALLLDATRGSLLRPLRGLPATPDAANDYATVYDTLKAYLIITAHHDKSTTSFLPPVLYNRLAAGQTIDGERDQLIRQQFEFYSAELQQENPYSVPMEAAAVDRARAYLRNFADTERVYRSIVADAGAKVPPINFNRQFPGSAETVLNSRDVPGAFTSKGFTLVRNAIQDIENYMKGEEWVVGPGAGGTSDLSRLRAELNTRYEADYLEHWRAYMKSATVIPFHGLSDAESRLAKLSGPASPILEMFSLSSRHTAVAAENIATAFQPTQIVVKPDTPDQFIQPGNQPYISALSNLGAAITLVKSSPAGLNDANAVSQALASATAGLTAVRQLAQGFRVDRDAHIEAVSQRILEQPFQSAITMLRGASAADANGAAADFCRAYDALMRKFPMNPNSREDASIEELNALFAPGQKFWQMYDARFSKVLVPQGSQYVASGTGSLRITPEFQRFFNSVADFSRQLYPGGVTQPQLSYALTVSPRNTVQGIALTIDGETLAGSGTRKHFTWPGAGQGLKISAGGIGEIASFEGRWGIFRFFSKARWTSTGSGYELEYPLDFAGQNAATIRYQLETASAGVFQRRLAGVRCTSRAAQ